MTTELLETGLLLLVNLTLLFASIVIFACFPLWLLWVLAAASSWAFPRATRGVMGAITFAACWLFTLAVELLILHHLFPGWEDTQFGRVALATLALMHMGISTPWVVHDLARSAA